MYLESFPTPSDGMKGNGKRKRSSEVTEETDNSANGLELPTDVVENTRAKRIKVKNGTIRQDSGNGLSADLQNRTDNSMENRKSLNTDLQWPESLSDAQLDLLVSIKHLAAERLDTINARKLEGLLPMSALRTIGILLEELAKDKARSLQLKRCDQDAISNIHQL